MAAETLVEALEDADFPSDADASVYFATLPRPHALGYRLRVAKDADLLFPLLARFASPEAKREVLRQLLGERLEEMADPEGDLMVSGWREDGERGSVWVTVLAMLALLAPEAR